MARDEDQPTAAFESAGGDVPNAVADPPLIASGRLLGGRYRLRNPLGHGGMASVWLADDERLGRSVAVKVISEALAHDGDYVGRFRREAKVAAGLQHPNLVAIYDFDAGPRPYLVMEYVAGGDLASRVAAGDAPDPERLGRELLAALRHIHGAGVLHRDIKPQNVLIDGNGRARLTDFGIAQPRDATALTRTGQVIGTESYLAPEVRSGGEASERSDLFSLGVLLSEVAPDGAGAAFWALSDRLRDPDPHRRPRSAAAALAELERDGERPLPGDATRPLAVPSESPAAAAPAPTPPRRPAPTESPLSRAFEPPAASRSSRSKAIAALAVAALAVALVVGLALGVGGGGDEDGAGDAGTQASAGKPKAGQDSGSGGEKAPAAGPSETSEAPAPEPAGSQGGGADGATLNDQGFALVNEGRHEEAIPILEQAREALADSGDEATYNYATYNLATAYLGAGRPQDAIPLLEERMRFDDGQLGEVRATLAEAYAAAGQDAPGDDGQSGDEPSEGESGSPGGGPPPWANNDDD